jgi:hypothetical protein
MGIAELEPHHRHSWICLNILGHPQWLADHTSIIGRGVFEKKDKIIKFNKEMSTVSSGFLLAVSHLCVDRDDPLVKEEVRCISF